MKISYSWLKDYIDIKETPEEIAEVLTQTGLEVEGIEYIEKIPGGLKGLIVGEIQECLPHPNADKLKLTKVDIGQPELLDIVCGAPNVAQGLKVVVAPVGTTLHPIQGDPFVIKKAKIRGESSTGMLCAEDEIGLGESHEGLLILDPSHQVGQPVAELFEASSDQIFEIGLTPNRGDATGHLGVARDLKAFYNRELKERKVGSHKSIADRPISVRVENPELCPRYSGVTLRGVKIGPSPDWLQWRLRAVGLAPINNVVDVTNYVMMSLGQPMHAFDTNAISGDQIVVKTLQEGALFTTLDAVERKLSDKDLMICNDHNGMCIAGVFGGIESGIKDATTGIFLESACFSADTVRATAMRHGLATDASFRFERGTDPEMTLPALHMAVDLILELAGGQLASDFLDAYPNPVKPVDIPTTYRNFHRLIGIEIPAEKILKILNSLDIETISVTEKGFIARVPAYRSDVTREADLIEEVLRIYGFNNIPLSESFHAGSLASFQVNEPYKLQENLSLFLSGQGFSEIQTNSLTNPKYYRELPLGEQPVEILNKSSEELGYLKTSLLYTSLESLRRNINRKIKNLRFFEFGKVYSRKENKFRETELLGLYMTGNLSDENWMHQNQKVGFYDLSATAHAVLESLKISNFVSEPTSDSRYAYGLQIRFNTKVVGTFGLLKSEISSYYDLKQDVFYGEFLWRDLVRNAVSEKKLKELSKFPEVRRDLSLVLEKHVSYQEIYDLAFKYEKKLLTRISVFSVYEGDQLEENQKSYALSFYLQDHTKTLTDKVIDKAMNGLISTFENEIGAIIRK